MKAQGIVALPAKKLRKDPEFMQDFIEDFPKEAAAKMRRLLKYKKTQTIYIVFSGRVTDDLKQPKAFVTSSLMSATSAFHHAINLA